MQYIVGHNDTGFGPDVQPLAVGGLDLARQVLANEVAKWFAPELDGEELTVADLRAFTARVKELRQGSTLVLRGHAFWIQ